MSDRPHPLIVPLLCLLPLLGCGEFGSGVDSYEQGDYEAALETFTRLAEDEAEDASPELLHNQALAALRVGELRRAAAALDGTSDRGADEFSTLSDSLRANLDFLRGNLAFAECELAEVQAGSAEAEPFAFDIAMAHARKAQASWQAAATAGEDWPAARRNVERALLKLAVLARKKAQAEQGSQKSGSQPNVNFKPAQTKEGERPKPSDEEGEGAGDDPADGPDAAASETELTADQVLRLLDTLAVKEREKLALRRKRRAARSRAEVEKDW